MAAPTAAAATVLTLRILTSSVPVGHVSVTTAPGGSANLAVKQAQVHHRVKVAHLTMTLQAVRAAAAVGVAAVTVGAVAAAAVMTEVHQHLLEMEGVLPSAGILARPVQVRQVLGPVQVQGARCSTPRRGVQGFDDESCPNCFVRHPSAYHSDMLFEAVRAQEVLIISLQWKSSAPALFVQGIARRAPVHRWHPHTVLLHNERLSLWLDFDLNIQFCITICL